MRDVIIYACNVPYVLNVINRYLADVSNRNLVGICRPCINNVEGFVTRINASVVPATQRIIVLSHGGSNSGWGMMTLANNGNGRLLTARALQNHREWNNIKNRLNNKDLFLLGCQTATTSPGGSLVVYTRSGSSTMHNSLSSLFKTTCRNTYTVPGLMYQEPGQGRVRDGNRLAFRSPTNYQTLFEIIRRPPPTLIRTTK